MTTLDVDYYPPYLKAQKQEINLLKGTKEYWDLLNHRENWWEEYVTTFYRQFRHTWPSMEFFLEGLRVNGKIKRATPPDEYMVMRSVNERKGM